MILVPLLASLIVSPAPQDTADLATGVLEFGWPDEGRVAVFERVLKKGQNAEMRYELSWSPRGEEGGLVVEYQDFRFASVNGIDATDPRIASALVQAETMAAAIPKLEIDGSGNLVGFIGFEAMIDKLLARMEAPLDGPTLETMRTALSQPAFQQMIETKTAEIWNNWVGNWVELEFERGTEEAWDVDMELSGGVVPELKLVYGERESYRGVDCLEITMEGKSDDERMLRMVLEFLGVLAEGLDTELPDELPIDRATKTVSVNGIYAVDGLRPLVVHTSDVTRVWATGEADPQEQIEEHSYYFDWEGVEPHGEGK